MGATVYARVGDALVRAEVPVVVAVFFRAAYFCGEEAAAAGVALIGLGFVEGYYQFGTELFECGCGHGDTRFACVG